MGLTRLDLMVNDMSARRRPVAFELRDRGRILAVAEQCAKHDIELNLVSWIMPHYDFLHEAADVLIPLAVETHARSIQWDAEEPWMRARDPMPYDAAGELVGKLFGAVDMATNAIGYASVSKLSPLLKVSAEAIPQCYSTSTSGVKPERVDALMKRWMDKFGHLVPEGAFTGGLAAYRQEGIEGHTEASAMGTAINELAAMGISRFMYWHLDELLRDRGARAVVRKLAKEGPEAFRLAA